MREVWKKILSKDGKLMYEGFTYRGKPHGAGTSYYETGSKCQEGVFNEKGLVYGREYYHNGNVRFEGAYKSTKPMAEGEFDVNYPSFGSCCDEDGNEFFYGELTLYLGMLDKPFIKTPECYGPVVPVGAPDFKAHKWPVEEKRHLGIYYVRLRGKKKRQEFVEFLEKNGFKCNVCDDTTRESTIESKFPILVDSERKVYGHLHTVTCAGAAASLGRVFPASIFIDMYESTENIIII